MKEIDSFLSGSTKPGIAGATGRFSGSTTGKA